jgi:hypothetical protein
MSLLLIGGNLINTEEIVFSAPTLDVHGQPPAETVNLYFKSGTSMTITLVDFEELKRSIEPQFNYIAEATRQERERCAKIADHAAAVAGNQDTAGVVSMAIANKIRSGL